MTTRDLKHVNAYREFRTPQGIDAVRNAVIANAPPAGTPIQQAKFTARFLNGNWIVAPLPPAQAGHAGHGANRLKYRVNPVMVLLVSYPDERDNFMGRVWNDRTRGYG